MATASPLLSEDQFLCSICLEIFTEPVSIPCGHNFCKACISKHWEGKERCVCPLCKEEFDKGLKLCVNTGFKEVVETFKEHHAIGNNDSLVKPGQVPCDCCLDNKLKAFKTCLVCLTSYCQAHLEPHRRVAALKRHKLTDPVHDLEDKTCKEHNRILELFCRNDLTPVCVLCTEHSSHDTVPLEEAYVDKGVQMRRKEVEVQEIKPNRSNRMKKTKVSAQTERKGKDEAIADSVESNQMHLPYIWFPNEGPHQLNSYFYLPQNVGISKGKFYYVVEVKGWTSLYLGIVRESMIQKRRFTFNTRSGAWIMGLMNNNICTALHNEPIHFCLQRKPERVIVFVDYEKGLVSFYDADTKVLIYTFTGCRFKQRIFLFYCFKRDVTWAEKIWSQLPYVILCFVLMLISLNAGTAESDAKI